MRSALLAALTLVISAAPRSARANALDTFGFSARAESMAGAMAADARGYEAAHHNPAGVALADSIEVGVGYGGAVMGLTIDGQDARVTSARGTSIGLAIPLKWRSLTVAFGVALYLPDQFVARIKLQPASEPHFALLDNDLQHVVVTPVLALRFGRWLSIGAGATVLADASGNGVNFDVGIVSGQKVGKASLDVGLPYRAAPVLGVTVLPRPWLRLGAAWRGAIDLGLKLDILANVDIAGVITGDTFISLRAINFYTPQKVSLGAAIDLDPSLTVSAELDWVDWSAFEGALPDLRVLAALGISPPLVQALFPSPRFNDVWTPRLGAEWRHDLSPRVGFSARFGYAYEHSPVPPQTGLTSFADNDRHIVALGAGVELRRLLSFLPRPVRLDVALQLHELTARTTVKDPRVFPGEGFTSGGYLLHLATTLTVKF
ncbi:MAG: OmpP1/FadL family transporter [Polyangia bacterium]